MKTGPTVIGSRTLVARTCYGCGEFKDANCFQRFSKTGYWQRWCLTCVGGHSNKSHKKANAESVVSASNHRNPWTRRDLEQLASLVAQSLTNREIAKIMSRSIKGIDNAKLKYLDKSDGNA